MPKTTDLDDISALSACTEEVLHNDWSRATLLGRRLSVFVTSISIYILRVRADLNTSIFASGMNSIAQWVRATKSTLTP